LIVIIQEGRKATKVPKCLDFVNRSLVDYLANERDCRTARQASSLDALCNDSDPDLSFDGINGTAIEGLNTKVLFNPFKEQFDVPARFVQLSDREGGQNKLVGKNVEPQIVFFINESTSRAAAG
jgi:hypothetical protein